MNAIDAYRCHSRVGYNISTRDTYLYIPHHLSRQKNLELSGNVTALTSPLGRGCMTLRLAVLLFTIPTKPTHTNTRTIVSNNTDTDDQRPSAHCIGIFIISRAISLSEQQTRECPVFILNYHSESSSTELTQPNRIQVACPLPLEGGTNSFEYLYSQSDNKTISLLLLACQIEIDIYFQFIHLLNTINRISCGHQFSSQPQHHHAHMPSSNHLHRHERT